MPSVQAGGPCAARDAGRLGQGEGVLPLRRLSHTPFLQESHAPAGASEQKPMPSPHTLISLPLDEQLAKTSKAPHLSHCFRGSLANLLFRRFEPLPICLSIFFPACLGKRYKNRHSLQTVSRFLSTGNSSSWHCPGRNFFAWVCMPVHVCTHASLPLKLRAPAEESVGQRC